MIKLLVLVLLSICACNCHLTVPAEDPKSVEEIDAGADAGACDKAEAHLRTLGCIDGSVLKGPDNEAGTADDKTFSQVCEDLEEDIPGAVNPECLIKIKHCSDMDGCAANNE
jgi:hypothetical protein